MTERNEMKVVLTFVNSPKKSTRHVSVELSIPRTHFWRLMHKLKLKPYRPRLAHCLLEDDTFHRLQFCEQMSDLIGWESDLLDKII
ncbi:hypothetical protein ANN_00860 [Periplaneta americana]|uniref:Uncharacterized protein n=1 Tax=Periplaneta americana TaxID=6978 RepID=A0ABQ8TUC8_PERAM|nr:hypothetical protein ANN_00860 [Periplaneta americana]